MEAEATPIVKRLGLQLDEPRIIPAPSSAHSYSGNVHDLDVHLVVNGKQYLLLRHEEFINGAGDCFVLRGRIQSSPGKHETGFGCTHSFSCKSSAGRKIQALKSAYSQCGHSRSLTKAPLHFHLLSWVGKASKINREKINTEMQAIVATILSQPCIMGGCNKQEQASGLWEDARDACSLNADLRDFWQHSTLATSSR